MEQLIQFPRGPPTPHVLDNCVVQTIEDGTVICPGNIIEEMVHDSGLVPVILMHNFPRVDHLVMEDLGTKIKVQSCGGADIGIVWAANDDILLPKFAGTTPALNTFGFRVRGNTSVKVRLVERIPTWGDFRWLNIRNPETKFRFYF